MSLAHLTLPKGMKSPLSGAGPFSGREIATIEGLAFNLPCQDPWIACDGSPGHAYLEAAAAAWVDNPEWMTFLDDDSPAYDLKRAEYDLYRHYWREPLKHAEHILDVGCGVGRFAVPLVEEGRTLYGVDADIKSLQSCAWSVAGMRGKLDLYWTTATKLPDIGLVDAAIAAEVLCYVPNAEEAVKAIFDKLKPGAPFMISVEAEYGWATAEDAPPGGIYAALTGNTLDIPGERWVRTFSRDQLHNLLTGAGLIVDEIIATNYLLDGPLERCAPESMALSELLSFEEAARKHPVFGPLNRLWMAWAHKPEAPA
jgi:SAM-dependent methyltransferase